MRQIYNSKIRETRLGWSQLFRISLLIMLFVMTFVFSSNAQNMTGTNKCYPSGSTAIGVDAQPSPYGTGYYYTLYRISTADVYNRIQYFAGPLSLPGAARDFTGLFNTPGQYKILIAPGPSTPSTGFTSSSIPGGYIAVSGEKWIYDAPTVETLDFSGTENTDYTIDANSWGVYCGSGNGSVTINTEGNYTYGSTWDVTYKLYKDAIAVDSITGNGSPKTWSGLADAEYYVTAKRDNCPENDMDNTKVVKTGIVTNTSTSLCYLTIQEAIDATPTVNTNVIKISNGSTSVYPENLYIDKEITLQPKLGDVPEIDGSIDIVADNVTIQDLFGVLSANPYAIKIHANADNYLIKNLSLINSVDKGIVLESGAGGGTIQGNTIMINTIGIDIAGSTAGVVNITGNFFEGNFTSDILNPVTNTNSVLITDNFFTDTPLAIDNYGSPMTITGNNFDNVPTAGTAINNTGANTMTINNNSFGGFNLNRTAITSNNALNAVSNWYGSAKGPIETANLCGEGWTVSSNITYSPWYGVNSMPGNSDTVTAFNATVASHTDNTCFGAALATITMNPTGGVTPYEYTYDGGANWVSYPSEIIDGLAHSGLAAGTYTITARSANGCEIAITPAVVITELPILSASVAHTDISCNGAADGTITITNPAGGSGYYKYRIDGGAHYSVSGSFGSLTNLTSYNVLIQDSLHKTCTISLVNPLDIIEPPVVAAPSTTTQTYEYDGSAYTVTATAALPGESIVWFANSTGGSSITAPAITNVGSVSAWAASYNGTCYSNDRTEVTVTITPKPLTIIGSTIASKIYDSFTTAGAVTPGTLSGFVFGETLSVTAVAADYPSANVNTYPATVITYTLVDATLPDIGSASNYSLANGSETGEITKANLEVTTSASDITYGDAAPTVTVNYTGFLGTDGAVDLDNVGFALGTDYTQYDAVGTYNTTIAIGTATDNNYNFTPLTPSTFNVDRKTVTPSITANDKCYDGNNLATLSSQTVSGVISPDVVFLDNVPAQTTFGGLAAGSYTVTATGLSLSGADAGNYVLSTTTATDIATINPIPTPVIVGSTPVCAEAANAGYAVLGGPIAGHTYQWVASGGNIVGNYNVYEAQVSWNTSGWVKVTETFNGCSTTTNQFDVVVNPLPAPIITGSTVVNSSDTKTYSTPNVPGNLFSWSVYDGTILSGQGSSTITVQWNNVTSCITGYVTVVESTPDFQTYYDGQPYGQPTNCFKSESMNISICPLPASASIVGYVKYNNAYLTPLNGVTVTLKNALGTVVATTVTEPNFGSNGELGYYSFHNLPAATAYTLGASFNGTFGGNNATDALKVQLQTTTPTTLSGINLIAADVNASSYVTSLDALYIKLRTVGSISSYPAGNWKFETPSVTTTSGTTPQNILGLCVGDVNGSYIPTHLKEVTTLPVTAEKTLQIQKGTSFNYDITSEAISNMGAMTLVMKYNENLFEVENLSSVFDGMKYEVKNGEISIAWADVLGKSFKNDGALLSLQLKAKEALTTATDIFSVMSTTEFADVNASIIDNVKLKLPKVITTVKGEFSVTNYPNPFSNITNITYTLPENSAVKISLTNMLGQSIATITNTVEAAGVHNVKISAADYNLTDGIYFYTIEVKSNDASYIRTNKLVLEK